MTGHGQAVFQIVAAATGNEWRLIVVRRYDGMNSWSVDDDRRRRWSGRSDNRTSWFKYAGAMPCWTRYAINATLKFPSSRRRSQCNIARTSLTWLYWQSWNTKWAAALKDGLEALMKIPRKTNKYEVAVVQPENGSSHRKHRRRWQSCHRASKQHETILWTWVAAPRSLLNVDGHPGHKQHWLVQWTPQRPRWDSDEAVTADAPWRWIEHVWWWRLVKPERTPDKHLLVYCRERYEEFWAPKICSLPQKRKKVWLAMCPD